MSKKLRSNPGRLHAPGARQVAAADGKRSAAARGYDYDWQVARAEFLQTHPLCRFCYSRGIVAAAAVVDHVRPHRGDAALFWDRANWQPLCKPCHDSHKQRSERASAAGRNVLAHGHTPRRR